MGHHGRALPDLVVLPVTTEETAAVVRLCYTRRVPLVTRGAGTGLEGGCIAYSGGVVLDTSLMRTKRMVAGEHLAVVGAGVLKNELNEFLRPHGMLFGPDPSSNPTIGGMASTGGSGMSTLKYGTSKENIRSMVVVTPSGRVIRTRKAVRKSSTGYELNALYLGAEGTLGVITELTVRLFPRPAVRCGAVVVFSDVAAAAETVVAAVASNLGTLLRCELMNDEGIRCTNAVFNTALQPSPTLFLEFVGNSQEAAEGDWRAMLAMATARGASSHKFAASGAELDELWDARRGCYLGAMKYRGIQAGEPTRRERVYVGDVCVPVSKLAQCVSQTEAAFKALNPKP
jgi:D-lactate dehydrogenase (cytochrome)